MKNNSGFSLVELMVVLAAGGVLVLFTAWNNVFGSMQKAAMAQAASNGKAIYEAAFQDIMDGGSWPAAGEFASSTDYFTSLVTNHVIMVTFDFFAARDIPPAKSGDPADFKAKNNAWKLVAGLEDARDGTPFIFTRNCSFTTVPTGQGRIPAEFLLDNDGKPFGTDGLAVVQKGGASLVLTGENLRYESFNPAGSPPGNSVLAVLNP